MSSIKQCLKRSRWQIGFLDNPEDILKDNYSVNWMKGAPKDRWFADPFILDVTSDAIEVLVEEVRYSHPIGRITKLTVDRNTWELKRMTPLLELETHLSFPAIRRDGGGRVYVYPENNTSGKLIEYGLEDNKLVFNRVLSDLPLTDAIQTDAFGQPLIFASKIDDECGNCLSIYKQDDNGKYIFDKDIFLSNKIGRMAGDIFEMNGKLYRPAQDCSKSYGGALVIQEFSSKNPIELKTVLVQISKHPKYVQGMHTFNTFKGVGVIDVFGYDHPTIVEFLKNIKYKAR